MSEMKSMAGEAVLVAVNVPPVLEDAIVDWLLERNSPAFTSYNVQGHSARHDHLSVSEQVSGRQRRLQFEVQLGTAALETFLADLVEAFAGSDLYYWATSIVATGHLGRAARDADESQRDAAAGHSGAVRDRSS
jgi:hypothetical protein